MTTVTNLITDLRRVFGDTSGDYLSDALCVRYYDHAQREFCKIAWPLYRLKGFSVAVNQDAFTIPDENIIIEAVVNEQTTYRLLKYVPVRDFFTQQMAVRTAVGTPTIYTHYEGKVHVYPRYSTASKTTTTGEAVQASRTSITLASNANLRTLGKVIINSEELEYTTKASVYISGVTRADGGTDAASHASGDTVTQLDLGILHRRSPIALATSAEPEIPEIFHEDLSDYVLYLAYMGEGQEKKAEFFLNSFLGKVKRASEVFQRKTLEAKAIRSIGSQRVAGLYGAV